MTETIGNLDRSSKGGAAGGKGLIGVGLREHGRKIETASNSTNIPKEVLL